MILAFIYYYDFKLGKLHVALSIKIYFCIKVVQLGMYFRFQAYNFVVDIIMLCLVCLYGYIVIDNN